VSFVLLSLPLGCASRPRPITEQKTATIEPDRAVSAPPENPRNPAKEDLPIPNENRFVMDFDAVRDLERHGGTKLSKGAYFAPSEAEILDANRAILRSLLTANGSEMFCEHSGCREFIMKFLDQYCVQYWGSVRGKAKRRVVNANFFLCRKGEVENKYPERRSDIVSVKGGGASYWAAWYEVESRKLEIVVNASE
jgi:hypothetical protein